jgi:hypothetical protein
MSEIENSASEAPAEETAAAAPPPTEGAAAAPAPTEGAEAAPAPTEDISYHAVEKDGQVTALWEMQGRRHLRTIDPRSREGLAILQHYTSDHHDEPAATEAPAAEAAAAPAAE